MPIRANELEKSAAKAEIGAAVAKFHARPSLQYRYEHYDPYEG